MRVRKLICLPKELRADTNWQSDDIAPKFAPIFLKTRPNRGTWKWRSGKAVAQGRDFVLFTMCNPNQDSWKSWLAVGSEMGYSVVGRFEHHGSHPGLHCHSHCGRSGVEIGASSMNDLYRFPPALNRHRRKNSWTEAGFWEASKHFFRISEPKGTLL